MSNSRAIFLDRDGVLIEEKHYLHRPEDVVVLPGVGHALARLMKAGYLLFIVTNQSGVGRGYFTIKDVEKVHDRLTNELSRHGVVFTHIYIAPEAPDQPSRGRKPSPQFLLDARQDYGVDLSRSYMVGDKLIDLECGWNAGVRACFLARTGYGAQTERELPPGFNRAIVVDDLQAMADIVLKEEISTVPLFEQENPSKSS